MKFLLVLFIVLISSQVYSQRIVKHYCYYWENTYNESGTTETVFSWNFDKNTVKQKTDGKSYETLSLISVNMTEGAYMKFSIDENSLGITSIAVTKKCIYVYYGDRVEDPFITYYISKSSSK